MNIKKLNEELSKLLQSEKAWQLFKKQYPTYSEESKKEDLTTKYIDIVMHKLTPVLGNQENIDTYRNSVKIFKRFWGYDEYPSGSVDFIIDGRYYEDGYDLFGKISIRTSGLSWIEVFSGYRFNAIGQVKSKYTVDSMDMLSSSDSQLIDFLLDKMIEAKKATNRRNREYIDYVDSTGDIT